jgi:hypothetical protein
MTMGTYTVTISGVDVLVMVSTISATSAQLLGWRRLFDRLLASDGPAPAASGSTLTLVGADSGGTPTIGA